MLRIDFIETPRIRRSQSSISAKPIFRFGCKDNAFFQIYGKSGREK